MSREEFEAEARAGKHGVLGEFWSFLRDNKKWWLIPILLVLLLLGILVLTAGSGVAPFIYTVF